MISKRLKFRRQTSLASGFEKAHVLQARKEVAQYVSELVTQGDVFAYDKHEEEDPSGALHAEELLLANAEAFWIRRNYVRGFAEKLIQRLHVNCPIAKRGTYVFAIANDLNTRRSRVLFPIIGKLMQHHEMNSDFYHV
jgi:hypothetical protein